MLRSKIKDQRGQALVELALVIPLIMTLLLGIVEFGRIYTAQLTLNNAVRAGARAACVGDDDTSISNQVTNICLANSLTSAELTINPTTPAFSSRKIGDSVSVSADYKVNLAVPIIKQIVDMIDGTADGKFKVSAQVSMRYE